MKLSCPSRIAAALVALFSMLFMQLAVAGYACPGMAAGQAIESATMSAGMMDRQQMEGCEGMDMEQPALCHAHAHDQSSHQSLDKAELPQVQPFVATGLAMVSHANDVAYRSIAIQPTSFLLTRATAPPLSIRNCCFRI